MRKWIMWGWVLGLVVAWPALAAERVELYTTDDELAGFSFGNSLAIAGDTIAVGNASEFFGASGSGSAFVYERDPYSGEWQGVKLLPHDGKPGDLFGASVALQQGKLVVGAPNAAANGINEAGAVYVFKRQAYGEWLQVAKLVADDPMPYARFGSKVALDADRIVTGAPGYDSWLGKGAAYLFEYDHHAAFWRQVKRLLPHDAVKDSVFARSVAIAGDFIAVGRFGADSVYVYKFDGEHWWKQVVLHPSLRSGPGSGAGWEVAMEGKTLAISAPEDLPPAAPEDSYTAGVVHVFQYDDGAWVRTAALSKPLIPDFFGAGLGMGEGYIAGTSAREGSSNAVFRRNSAGEWVEVLSFPKRDINEILPIAVSSKYLAHPIWPRGDFHPCIVVYKLPDLIANPGTYSLAECAKPIAFEPADSDEEEAPAQNGNPDDDESLPDEENATGGDEATQPPAPSNDSVAPARRSGGGSAGIPLFCLLGLFALGAHRRRATW